MIGFVTSDACRAIHRLQRESQTLEGLLARRDADRIRELHRNAQRLLQLDELPPQLTTPSDFAAGCTFSANGLATSNSAARF